MTLGVLRLCSLSGERLLYVTKPTNPARFLSRTARLFQKDGKPAAVVKGVPYNSLKIGVPKEKWVNERHVSVTPAVTATFVKNGFTVQVEPGAGFEAKFRDQDYIDAGAKIVDAKTAFESDIV